MRKNSLLALVVLLLASCFTSSAAWADPLSCTPGDDFWLGPRSGASVLANAALAPCVHAVLDDAHSRLVITYPDGDEAAVRANELRQWLIALALPAARIVLQQQPANTTIELETRND